MRQAMLALMSELSAKDEQLRDKAVELERSQREAAFKQSLIDKLTHEMAVLKRLKFAATSEKFCAGLSAEQKSLLEETLDGDIAEVTGEIERATANNKGKDKKDKEKPKRQPLPAHLPRREMHHEPESTVCSCGCQMKRILVDALEAELLRHDVLHADETPVAMLKPGNKKTHKAYIWSYCTTSFNSTKAVVFNFAETRSGENVRKFLGQDGGTPWNGTLVTDGYSGYNATIAKGVTAANCLAHARRKFHELWANHDSKVGEKALRYFRLLFKIEAKLDQLPPDERRRIRKRKSRRVAALLYKWLLLQRQQVPPGSATIKAIDYSLKRWPALTRYIEDGDVPISNNWVENQIRPIALGRGATGCSRAACEPASAPRRS